MPASSLDGGALGKGSSEALPEAGDASFQTRIRDADGNILMEDGLLE